MHLGRERSSSSSCRKPTRPALAVSATQYSWSYSQGAMWCNSSVAPSGPQVKLRQDYPCLNSEGRISLPLPWDPPARQVPLFMLWEKYASYLPHGLGDVTFVQIGAK